MDHHVKKKDCQNHFYIKKKYLKRKQIKVG